MSGRTASLIRKAADAGRAHGVDYEKLKRYWYSLNRHERAGMRKQLLIQIAKFNRGKSV